MYQEIKDYVIAILRSRLFPLCAIFILMFAMLISRLFKLQIIDGEKYLASISDSLEAVKSISATRGNIYDCNGVLLAYNELAFSVKISDSGTYDTKKEKNATINEVIAKAVSIIKKHGEKVNCDYPIILNEDGKYEFNVSESSRNRFLRDVYGHKSISELTPEEKNSSASEVIEYLSKPEIYGIDSKYDKETVIYILNFRYYMSANTYQRSMEFTMSYDVNEETVAEILENSRELIGVTVSEEYVRKYNDGFYAAHILGYTGKISAEEFADLSTKDEQYTANDVVGKSGIEQSMELYLQGKKGERKVYVDNVGRITEIIEETPPVTGGDVYLTIDIELQKNIYSILEKRISEILVNNIVENDEKYKYKSDGTTITNIYIPIKEVYFALIDNNVISLKEIESQKTSTQTTVYNNFLKKQEEVIERLRNELLVNDTDYGELSEEMQVYIYKIYELLLDDGVVIKSNVDKTDSMYEQWQNETISLNEYLSYALSKNWIDVGKFTNSEYSSLSEAYNSLVEYILEDIKTETEFSKKIYKYMIKYKELSGSQICILLYDQGVLQYDSSSYGKLIMGTLNPYSFLKEKIANCEITPAQLALKPCSGSCSVIDTNTGRILALVSYPSYDINNFSGSVDANYYYKLLNDSSLPLVNNATTTKTAPGSAYKMVSTVAGLETGVINAYEEIKCTGVYETVTPNPKCWNLNGHGDENVTEAIRDSCNIYFYELGYRLATTSSGKYDSNKATDILAEYARRMGLATTTGIEISESTPIASNENAIATAIGQGRNCFTGLNLARYVSTIANSGVCYDLTLVDKVVDSNGNEVLSKIPIVSSTMNDVSDSTWNVVHTGMKMVSDASSILSKLPIKIGSKTGTAQENTKQPDHCDIVCYAPYDNPEIALSVVIQNGYTSANATKVASDVLKLYFDLDVVDTEEPNQNTEDTLTHH